MVGVVEAGLDAVKKVEEAVVPRRVDEGVRQLDEAVQPLRIRHGLDVAEVGLGRLVQRRDDVVATGVVLFERQRRDETRCRGEGVVQVVDVREQVGLGGSHTVSAGAAANPAAVRVVANARGVDEEFLDGVRGLGLLGGHGDGADEDGIDRHGGHIILGSPGAGEVGRGALRGVDAAAHGEVDVGVQADLGVGLEQHVVEVDPRVVAASVAVLDLDDDLILRVRGGDLEHVANLLRGARLEGDEGEAVLVQLCEELGGLVDLRDTGGHTHAVERSAGRAGLGHDAGLAELQVPQEAVEEHGVELGGAARLEFRLHDFTVLGEDLVGVHAATGHLRPVTGVGGRGDDLAVGRGRRHAAKHDGRQAREIRETGLRILLAVRQADEAGSEVGVVHRFRQGVARRGQRVTLRRGRNLDDGGAGAGDKGSGEASEGGIQGEEVIRVEGADLCGPIVRLDEDGAGQRMVIDAAVLRPLFGERGRVTQAGVVEGQCYRQLVEGRDEFVATHRTLFQVVVEGLGGGLERGLRCLEVLRRASEHERAAAIDDGDGGIARDIGFDEFAGQAPHSQHVRACVRAAMACRCRRPHQDGKSQGFLRILEREHAEGALGVAGGEFWLESQLLEVLDGRNLAEDDAGNGVRREDVHRLDRCVASEELL